MLTFTQLLEELSRTEVVIDTADVQRMIARLGERTLHMGNLDQDGSLRVSVDCILEAVQSLGNEKLIEAVEGLQRPGEVVHLLQSVESLVDRVSEARTRKLARLVDEFQSTPDDAKAQRQWREIEKVIFGVDFDATH